MSPVSHVLPYDQTLSKAGSIGILLPNLEARLVEENGADVDLGGSGELWLRGPTVMKAGSQHMISSQMDLTLYVLRVI